MSSRVEHLLGLLALVVALAALMGCAGLDRARVPVGWHLSDERSFRDYTVRVYESDETMEGSFEILRRGRRVYSASGGSFGIDKPHFDDATNVLSRMGRNITGDGQPDLVVAEWTGGAHCCSVFRVFEIGERFQLLDTINAADTAEPAFRDLRGDGTLDLVMNDHTFAYWNASFAQSPAPEVLLRYRDGRYGLDLDLMRKPTPTAAGFSAQAAAVRHEFDPEGYLERTDNWAAPAELWGAMLDLIYSGNVDSAWRLCDEVWPADWPGKPAFLREFMEQLATSPYFQDLMRLNSSGNRPHPRHSPRAEPKPSESPRSGRRPRFPFDHVADPTSILMVSGGRAAGRCRGNRMLGWSPGPGRGSSTAILPCPTTSSSLTRIKATTPRMKQ